MIWIWLGLAIIPTVALLSVGSVVSLLARHWWHRREARKHAKAMTQQTVAAMVAATQPVGETLLNEFRQLAPLVNDVSKLLGQFGEALRAVPAATDMSEHDPDRRPVD